MSTKAVIIVPSDGEHTNAFENVAKGLKRRVYDGSATIVKTKLVDPGSPDKPFKVEFKTLDGHTFSWATAHGLSSIVTISHGYSGDGPNLAYHDSRFDEKTHRNQPWGSDPNSITGEMGQQGKDFWRSIATVLRADGKIILLGCFMGDGYTQKVACLTGKAVYGSKNLFGAGNEKVAVPQVQAIEAGKKPKLLKAASPNDCTP